MRRTLGVLAVAASSCGVVHADVPLEQPTAIEVDRDASVPGRPELGFDGGAPIDGWAAAFGFGWLVRPIAFRTTAGDSFPVEHRQTFTLGGAMALGRSAIVDLRFPFARQSGDRLLLAGGVGDPRALDRWVPGDLRIGARVRVVAMPRLSAFVRGELTWPTGDDRDFSGDASWSLGWSLIGRVALPAGVSASLAGGIRLRGAEVIVADRVISNELFGAVGVAIPVPPIRPLWCVAEQVKLAGEIVGILGDDIASRSGPSPVEIRFGVVTRPREDVTIGVRVGRGLIDDEIGAPQFRAMIELSYQGSAQVIPPVAPEPDTSEGLDDDPETEGE